MGKLRFGKMLDRLCLSSSYGTSCCICINGYGSSFDGVDDLEKEPLVGTEGDELVRLKDFVEEPKSLALQLKPKIVVLRVSMHCNGCARKVEKHISKMDGVTSYQIDLETKMVVIMGDIVPFEVVESIAKVKNAEFWQSPSVDHKT
ncbi:hypothetical protein DCAR_0518420 [Daucus carota subsp. sativus]|uniref:Uncharacterized protein n=1 Tax=Daucus carota subsp. sativus TaxID=79200 RepID=A0A164X8C6_DAUCS|nr:PREDICTED: uncharacterized protein LOC108192508 [Daucus carota subsp. sativus]XP_017250499.1 PREDICTED: uncharacterized protein LOC108221109 [Daucus carota subsp. sativus]WOG99072.1 hypothetical protein DCAR_0518420 [Daucus carota subsp. sativus]